MLVGTWMSWIVRSIAASPAPSDTPSGKLNEIDVDAEVPVWLTVTGVVEVAKRLNAESGTTVSRATLIAEPVEVLPRPAFAREFDAKLRAASVATCTLAAAPAGAPVRNFV